MSYVNEPNYTGGEPSSTSLLVVIAVYGVVLWAVLKGPASGLSTGKKGAIATVVPIAIFAIWIIFQ
jgi:hypothetical protein